jgi:hypothetical protein
MDAGPENVKHAIRNDCEDPDCEIHHPEVGLAEETVTQTNLAFYIAGAYWGQKMALDEMKELSQTIREEAVNLASIEYL